MGKKFKNTLIPALTIEGVAADGKCVARWNEIVVFVTGVVPGDIADVRVVRQKRNYLEGVAEKVLQESDKRSLPFCTHFGLCGGCKWQNISYEHQLEFKRQQVIDNFQRIGEIACLNVEPTLPSPLITFHRNKLEFTFSNRRWLTHHEINSGRQLNRKGVGFHKSRQFDKVVDIEYCHLQADPSNEIRNSIRAFAIDQDLGFYDIREKTGFLRNLIVRITSIGEIMVILQVGEDHPKLPALLEYIKQSYPQITSLMFVINPKGNETFFDLPVRHYAGQEYINEKMGALQFQIGPKSFYQTNSLQAHQLYDLVKSLADLSGSEVVFDLYTGAGTIGLYMASNAKQVVGIDLVPEAILNARRNAEINSITNSTFYAGDIKDTLGNGIIGKHGSPDVVITDPPRAGMHLAVIERLIALAPQKILYISCNPSTQARDLAVLKDHYELKSIHPVDMFPHTPHVECVVHLQKL